MFEKTMVKLIFNFNFLKFTQTVARFTFLFHFTVILSVNRISFEIRNDYHLKLEQNQ